MDFDRLIRMRESCRTFSAVPVEREKLENMIEAARLAPSACNGQPWRFYCVTDPEDVSACAECTQTMGMNRFASGAQAFIVLCEEKQVNTETIGAGLSGRDYVSVDIGIAASYLTLSAAEQGLGTCIIGWFSAKKLSSLLELPAGRKPRLVIAVGYPANPVPREKRRKDVKDLAVFR